MLKTCKQCGKEFDAREPYHQYCFDCHIKRRKGGSSKHKKSKKPKTGTDFKFDRDYLKDGYFQDQPSKDGEPILRPEILVDWPIEIAKLLGNRGMKINQLRRFFNKTRGIEAQLTHMQERDFAAVKPTIRSMERDVAYQVGREVVPEEFKQFIDRNVELAVKDEAHFKAFLNHFESVLSYFVYYHR